MPQAERFQQLMCTQHLRADLSTRSVRAAGLTTASSIADFVLRIGSTALLARMVLPDHFGLIMMATAVTGIADQLRDLGLSSATVQQPEITHAQVSNLFWVNAAVGSTLAVLLCAASPLIAGYYHEPRLVTIACVLSVTLVCGGLTVQHEALLTRQLRLGRLAGVRLTSSVLSTALAVGLAWSGFGYWALLWREVCRTALLVIGVWLSLPWLPGLPRRGAKSRRMLGFGANLTTANLLASVASATDRFLLGRNWGASAVALYRQSYQLITVPVDQLPAPLYQVMQPCLSMLQGDPERYRRFYTRVLTIVCLLTMPVSAFVFAYSKEITLLVLGERWLGSAAVLQILSVGAFMRQPVGSTCYVLVSRGAGRVYLHLFVVSNAALVVLMLGGVHWGAVGIATADVATTYLLMIPRLWYTFRGSPITIRTFFATVSRPLVASLVMVAGLFALRTATGALSLMVALGSGAALASIVFVAVWVWIPGGLDEARGIMTTLRSALERRTANTPAQEPAAVGS